MCEIRLPFLRALVILSLTSCDLSGADSDSTSRPIEQHGLNQRPANPTCIAPARPVAPGSVRLENPFLNLPASTFPSLLELRQAPGEPGFFHAVSKNGTIRKFPNRSNVAPSEVKTYISLGTRVNAGPSEAGLLGMAFHPNFQSNKRVYLSYTAPNGTSVNLRSKVTRYVEKADGTLDPASLPKDDVFPRNAGVANLLDQPYTNHNGGGINFGPDGMLYFALGDGGSADDPQNNAENLNVLFGKMLRVDVDNVPDGQGYGIPATNPFSGAGVRAEIFAYGLRNPWRFSFDRGTGELWAGDVGQNAWEEVDVIKLGGHYGWDTREAAHCHEPTSGCSSAGMIDPIVEYSHASGRCSITGGYVYRGAAMPSLQGTYFYSDYCSGELFSITYDPMSGQAKHTVLLDAGIGTQSFAEALDGELYMLGSGGEIRKLVAAGTPPPDTFPKKLSQTGCVDAADAKLSSAGMIPYDVNAPLWSDGAEKGRWLAVPDGQKITIKGDGDWDLPNGSVLMKTFMVGGRRVETRLFMRHPDGGWAGYSYEWNDAQSDATLLPAGKTKSFAGQSWTFPSRTECVRCHTDAAGRTLGLETGQLNRAFDYPQTGKRANQVSTLDHIGMFTTPAGDPTTLAAYPEPFGSDPVEKRARAYLHANCAFCHRQGGPGQGEQDLRFSLDFKATKLCNVAPGQGALGVSGAKLIAPGNPDKSIVSLRMRALDSDRMPPLSSAIADQRGVDLIDQWIAATTTCP